jgi:hypothetical protein
MSVRRFPVMLATVAGLLVACSSSAPPSTEPPPTTVGPSSAPPSTAAATGQPFVSASYGYTVTSTDWTGTDAKTTWGGTGFPGAGDPAVDVLDGPEGVEAYAFGEPTSETLKRFVADALAANAKVHPCSAQMPPPTAAAVAGAPAALQQGHCPPPGGIFVISAMLVHAGRAYVFFTESIPAGTEPFTRNWFLAMLRLIRFTN